MATRLFYKHRWRKGGAKGRTLKGPRNLKELIIIIGTYNFKSFKTNNLTVVCVSIIFIRLKRVLYLYCICYFLNDNKLLLVYHFFI